MSWVAIALSIQFIVGNGDWAFPNGTGSATGSACSPVRTGSQVMQNKNICNLYFSLDEGSNRLAFLCAFILGGYLLTAVNMWRLRRTAYCQLCGATRNLLINLCTIVEDQAQIRVLTRWAVMGYELSILKARGLIDLEEAEVYLGELHLLESNEWAKLINGERHTTGACLKYQIRIYTTALTCGTFPFCSLVLDPS